MPRSCHHRTLTNHLSLTTSNSPLRLASPLPPHAPTFLRATVTPHVVTLPPTSPALRPDTASRQPPAPRTSQTPPTTPPQIRVHCPSTTPRQHPHRSPANTVDSPAAPPTQQPDTAPVAPSASPPAPPNHHMANLPASPPGNSSLSTPPSRSTPPPTPTPIHPPLRPQTPSRPPAPSQPRLHGPSLPAAFAFDAISPCFPPRSLHPR